jgi:hypothetical protein
MGLVCSDRTPIGALPLVGNRRARFSASPLSRGRGASRDYRVARVPRIDPQTLVGRSLGGRAIQAFFLAPVSNRVTTFCAIGSIPKPLGMLESFPSGLLRGY